ncbi:VOC family protein [soil metagenome]
MGTRTDPWPDGTPCWVDLAAPDVDAARDFYGAVMGWDFEGSGEEYGHYQVCRVDGHAAAGIGAIMSPDQPSAWTLYFATSSAERTAQAVTDAGGAVLAPPFDVPDQGRMLVAADPQGAAFGVWEARGHIGAQIVNEPGSLVWEEAAVPDPDPARDFYTRVFGYRHEPVEGAGEGYTTFHAADSAGQEGDTTLGGIGGLAGSPPGTPAHWLCYFAVADADATARVATEHGGSVPGGVRDSAYGRIATITDPYGATFAVIGLSEGS